MFSLGSWHRYYLYLGSCDMRKGFDTLCSIVRRQMKRDPLGGDVYIFINRGGNRMKLLHWEPGGFVLYYKRLEQGTFALAPRNTDAVSSAVGWWDLILMVEGVIIQKSVQKKRYKLPQKITENI